MLKLPKIIITTILVVSTYLLLPQIWNLNALANEAGEKVDIYIFHSNTCPHCANLRDFLDRNSSRISEKANLYMYELSSEENIQKLITVGEILDTEIGYVPHTIIGGESFVGYDSDEITGEQIIGKIDYCYEKGCSDPLASKLLGNDTESTDTTSTTSSSGPSEADVEGTSTEQTDDQTPSKYRITIPIINIQVNLQDLGLPIATVILGLLDGFNPCAMWVLLFLISLLIGLKDRRKMWILGLTFILTSGLVYFVFLVAWLQIFAVIGLKSWLTIAIGIFALGAGIWNLNKYRKERNGCLVSEKKNRKEVFNRIKDIIARPNIFISLAGIALLAVSINVVELVCSAGLPAIFTGLLTVSETSAAARLLYSLAYILLFMLDDLVIFFLAMFTLRSHAISTKYGKYNMLVGGIVMAIIGILLIFSPGTVMGV